MKNTARIISIILLALLINSCDISKNKKEGPEYVLKIYNTTSIAASFKPKDVVTLPDGSYLVLSTTPIPNSSFSGISVSKISSTGEFMGSATLDANWAYAIPNLFAINQKYYTIAMDVTSLSALLIEVDQNLVAKLSSTIDAIQYPISAGLDGDNQFVIQSYNREDKETIVSKVNISGAETARKSFPIGFGDNDVEVPILRHFTREDERLPFLSGSLGGGRFYFNGFYNYHLSTVYFSFGSSAVKPGYLLGFETDRMINGFLPLGGGFFALSKSDYKNYELIPRVQLNTADAQFSSNDDLKGGYKLPELKGNTSIKIRRLTLKGKDVVVYISDTKGKQLVLYFYDANSGVLLSTKYLGDSNPFEMGGIVVTPTNSLVIIGTCYVGSRYPKICYFSLTENQLTL